MLREKIKKCAYCNVKFTSDYWFRKHSCIKMKKYEENVLQPLLRRQSSLG